MIHHGVADILDQAAKLIHVLDAFQEPCDLASLCQWGKVSEDIFQFPSKSRTTDLPHEIDHAGHSRLPGVNSSGREKTKHRVLLVTPEPEEGINQRG